MLQSIFKEELKKLFVWRHPTLGFPVGSVGLDFLLFWWSLVSFPRPYYFLIETWLWKKESALSVTIFLIDSDKALVDQCNVRIRLNWWASNNRGIILICRCQIHPYYVYILFKWKSKCSRSCCFYMIISFFNLDLNRGCLFYIFSLRFLGSKFLIILRRHFRVRKLFSCP